MKHLPKSQIEFEAIIPFADWEKFLDVAASEFSEELKIDGFRPGKAPRSIVEQKVGREAVRSQAAEKAIGKNYTNFVLGEKLDVIGSPKVEILEIKEGGDLKYKAVVSVMPQVTVGENYRKGIKKINEEFLEKSPTAEEKEVELELEKIAANRVKLVTVRRAAEKGDSVEVDFEVFQNQVPIENGKSTRHPLILGRGVFIPGFEEQLVGMQEGEEKEFELTFPEKYHAKNLAGQVATFKVKMLLVQDRQTPKIDDDLAKSLGKFESLEDLKKNIRSGLEHENKHRIQEEKRGKFMEEIIRNAEGDLPDILIDKELEKMMEELEYQLSPTGMNLEKYLAHIKKDKKDLEKDWRPQAEKRVLGALALSQVAKMMEIKVESGEVEEEMNKTLKYYKGVKDAEKNIDMERLYNYSKGILENEKVFKMLEKI